MKKSLYSETLAKKVANQARVSHSYHVIPRKNNWAILKHGNKKASKIIKLKRSAISFAKKLAISASISRVIVHSKNGMVKEMTNI